MQRAQIANIKFLNYDSWFYGALHILGRLVEQIEAQRAYCVAQKYKHETLIILRN